MNQLDVRLLEPIPGLPACMYLTKMVNTSIGSKEHIDVARRGREAVLKNPTGTIKIYGDLENITFDKVILEVRQNVGFSIVEYDAIFTWFDVEFPNHVVTSDDRELRDFNFNQYLKRTHTYVLTGADALKFHLMFSCSHA
jgi:hypothetical protein